MDLFEKCRNFNAAKEVEAMGLYPYFRRISSMPGTQVIAEADPQNSCAWHDLSHATFRLALPSCNVSSEPRALLGVPSLA